PAVYPDGAGVEFFGDAVGAIQVLRPNARCQAVLGVVSVADHFFFVVERRDRDDRAEDFFTVGAAGDWEIGDDSWFKKITIATTIVDRIRRFATKSDFTTFLLRKIDIELHLIELRFAYDRALFSVLVERIAPFKFRRFVEKTINEIIVGRSCNEDAGAAETHLALICEGRGHTAGDGGVQIGVGEDDVWIFSSELE